MKFGSVENPEAADLTLPADAPETERVLRETGRQEPLSVHVGCAKWNRQELKNFYPRGTKDELAYYGSRFNSIELNATFYRNFPPKQVESWAEKVPAGFRFFPKVNQEISHRKWLSGAEKALDDYVNSIIHFREKLGTAFLQLRDNFTPKHMDRVAGFLDLWPRHLALALEFRHSGWFDDPAISADLYRLLEEKRSANVIVDTAGRRDLLHMRLTNNEAFVRFVGANHPSDYRRLEEWVERLKSWTGQGLRKIHFFVHQNEEVESPLLAAHFIGHLNRELGTALPLPVEPEDRQNDLF